MAKSVYDIIKKQNGEKFAQKLRNDNLLDIPDIIDIVRYAGHTADDAAAIAPYLWSLKHFKETDSAKPGDPFELLHRAGYEYVEYADTLEKQNAIKKYFRSGEELCTFKDNTRYQKYYILNAVKYNIGAIRPSNSPRRQDEYGTSVISIQMLKTGGFISIKNRYNHTVDYPDSTFDNNPDNIIPGLSAALKQYFDVDWKTMAGNVPDGFAVINGRIIKYNFEINNIYVGDNFYESHGQIYPIDKAYQMMLDYFIWDNKQKKIIDLTGSQDAFVDMFNEYIHKKKVKIKGRTQNYSIYVDNIEFVVVENNQIVSLNLPNVTKIGDGFLLHNQKLTHLDIPNVTEIGDWFLFSNKKLTSLELPNVTKIGGDFLFSNKKLTSLELPNVTKIGDSFSYSNKKLTSLELPNVTKIGGGFLHDNQELAHLEIPNLTKISVDFLCNNKELTHLELPNVTKIGDAFLYHNENLANLELPNVTEIGGGFLHDNQELTHLELPNVTEIGYSFLYHNQNLASLEMPNVTEIGDWFLCSNKNLTSLELPNVTKIGDRFLRDNEKLTHLDMPNVTEIGDWFLFYNKNLTSLELPNVTEIGTNFLYSNTRLTHLKIPDGIKIGEDFLNPLVRIKMQVSKFWQGISKIKDQPKDKTPGYPPVMPSPGASHDSR